MKRTKKGIPYVESTDYTVKFPEHMKEMAEIIDSLFDELFRRIDDLQEQINQIKSQRVDLVDE